MSFFDKARKAVTGAVDKHGDKIATGIDKAAAAADKKTGGKHSGQLAGGAQKAKEALEKLDGKNDDLRDDRHDDRRDDRGPR